MEVRNLNTFLQVAALQNFTRAGQELGYSQSSVSTQIKQLEQEVGYPLFDRVGKGVSLTPYGEALLPYARQVVSTVFQMQNFMKSEQVLGGVLRVGIVDSLFELLLDNALVDFHRRFPRVQLDLNVDAVAVLLGQLEHGLLDAACIISDPLPKSDWLIWDTVEVPILLVANPAHPLARREQVALEDLPGQELILMEASAPYSKQFQKALTNCALECRPFLRLQSADTARRLVEQYPFLSVLPLYTVQASIRAGRLCRLTVPQWSYSQQVQLVLHRSKVITPQIQGFFEILQLALGNILAEKLSAAPPAP